MKRVTLIRHFEEASEEWERTREWKRQAPRGSPEWKRLRNRLWECRRRLNKLGLRLQAAGEEA